MPAFLTTSGSQSERNIRSDLNKLAPGNYSNISRRIKIIADVDNLTFTIRLALEKAYLEPEHNTLYVNLFRDILDSLAPDAKTIAIEIVREELPVDGDHIRAEALLPLTDPAKNYEAFCDACRAKRRIVGRGSTFSSILDITSVSSSVDTTPKDIYKVHERVMMDIVCDANLESDTVDVPGAVEIMLESLDLMINHHKHLRDDFRAVIEDLDISSFPTAKCRFKIMDILGR